jgi:16S rRNA (guanine966-N2)-methyltransferase
LPVADVEGLRPTSERVRETLFNWLAPVIDGARCLDLFAGTGALGLEALSRGAAQVDLVECAATAASQLRENVRLLEAAGATVHQADAFEFIRQRGSAQPCDIVFLDPPFADARYEELCRLLDERGWLAPGALIYIEQDRSEPLPDLPVGWRVRKEKTASNVRYSLIETVTRESSQ